MTYRNILQLEMWYTLKYEEEDRAEALWRLTETKRFAQLHRLYGAAPRGLTACSYYSYEIEKDHAQKHLMSRWYHMREWIMQAHTLTRSELLNFWAIIFGDFVCAVMCGQAASCRLSVIVQLPYLRYM